MIVLEKCGRSLADLHNARGFESKYLSLHFDLCHGKHSVIRLIILVFCQGSVWFRVGSVIYIHPSHWNILILCSLFKETVYFEAIAINCVFLYY